MWCPDNSSVLLSDLPAFYLLQEHDWSIHRPARTRCSPHWILSWEIPAETDKTLYLTSARQSSLSRLLPQLLETGSRVWRCEQPCVSVGAAQSGRALLWLELEGGEERGGSAMPELNVWDFRRCRGLHSKIRLLCGSHVNINKILELTNSTSWAYLPYLE